MPPGTWLSTALTGIILLITYLPFHQMYSLVFWLLVSNKCTRKTPCCCLELCGANAQTLSPLQQIPLLSFFLGFLQLCQEVGIILYCLGPVLSTVLLSENFLYTEKFPLPNLQQQKMYTLIWARKLPKQINIKYKLLTGLQKPSDTNKFFLEWFILDKVHPVRGCPYRKSGDLQLIRLN